MLKSKYFHHIKTSFLLGYPVMIAMFGQIMTGVADSIMLGWTGTVPLAACSLANAFYTIPLTFGIGLSLVITPLVAEAYGAGNSKRVAHVLQHAHVINIMAGVVLIILAYLFIPLLSYMDQPVDVVQQTRPYLFILIPSFLPTLIFQTYKQFLEGLRQTQVIMLIMIGCNIVNIGLNYLLIFGHGGFSPMGIEGAGWATLISRIMMAVAAVLYVYGYRPFKDSGYIFSDHHYQIALFKKILHMGLATGGQFLFETGAFSFSGVMMGWIGAPALAAHQIAINLAMISYLTVYGLSSSASIQVGYFLGLRDYNNLQYSVRATIWIAMCTMLAWASFFVLGRHFLPGLYIDDPVVRHLASSLLIITALFQFSDGMQVVCNGALRGLQDVKVPTILIFIAYWVVALPLGYVLAFFLDMKALGIWLGLFIGLTFTAVVMWIRFHRLFKQLKSHVLL